MSSLAYNEYGSGRPVILVHGFPFSKTIWNSFAQKLGQHAHVFTIDLPGFGQSPLNQSSISIDTIGTRVNAWVKETKIRRPVLLGHSLGGYVTLAAANQEPDLFSGLVLFHSTAYADSEEKKQSRNKVLEFIDKNGVDAFTSNFIGPLFYDSGHPAIPLVRTVAREATAEAVKAYTQAMRDRSERTDVLQTFRGPVLFLAGENDSGIPVESVRKQAALHAKSEVKVLSETGHMGMFENEKKCLEIIRIFIDTITVTK
jgi:pimeloyl-ACP methyl ester carboxylesterase